MFEFHILRTKHFLVNDTVALEKFSFKKFFQEENTTNVFTNHCRSSICANTVKLVPVKLMLIDA
jgi:hypothetical protein